MSDLASQIYFQNFEGADPAGMAGTSIVAGSGKDGTKGLVGVTLNDNTGATSKQWTLTDLNSTARQTIRAVSFWHYTDYQRASQNITPYHRLPEIFMGEEYSVQVNVDFGGHANAASGVTITTPHYFLYHQATCEDRITGWYVNGISQTNLRHGDHAAHQYASGDPGSSAPGNTITDGSGAWNHIYLQFATHKPNNGSAYPTFPEWKWLSAHNKGNGKLDDVRIFNAVLDPAQIANLANGGNGNVNASDAAEAAATTAGISATNVTGVKAVTFDSITGGKATADATSIGKLKAIVDGATGATKRKRRRAALKLMFVQSSASTVTKMVIPKANLSLPATFKKANAVVVKAGETFDIATLGGTEGFYSVLDDGEEISYKISASVTAKFTRADSGADERYTISLTNGTFGSIVINADSANNFNANGTGYLVPGDVIGLAGRDFFIGSVGDGGASGSVSDPYVYSINSSVPVNSCKTSQQTRFLPHV
jgi:hypothetical protein